MVKQRVEAIDFWRGIVLIAIMMDHVPGNLLEHLTPRNYGLSDSAEAFVFLSGVSVAFAYYRASGSALAPIRRCVGRALRIYGVHIGLTCGAIIVFALAYSASSLPDLIENDGRVFVFHKPVRGFLGILALTQQLGYFNILPLYVVLLLWAPVALIISRRSPVAALTISAAVYVTSRAAGIAPPNWPEAGSWFFNPFAWQLLFTSGIVTGIAWRGRSVPRSLPLIGASAALVLAAAAVVTDGLGLLPGLRDAAFRHLDILKQNLGLVRLLHFLAAAYLLSQVPMLARLMHTAAGRELQRLGRHSLAVFSLGSILAAAGQAIVRLAGARFAGGIETLAMLYTLFGIMGFFLLARFLEWTRPAAALASNPLPAGPVEGMPSPMR